MIYVESLSIDDHILEKIETKHNIRFEEVEDICTSERHHVRKSREGIYKVFGQTVGGRHVLVVLIDKGGGEWKIATARMMTENEKRQYRKVMGGK